MWAFVLFWAELFFLFFRRIIGYDSKLNFNTNSFKFSNPTKTSFSDNSIDDQTKGSLNLALSSLTAPIWPNLWQKVDGIFSEVENLRLRVIVEFYSKVGLHLKSGAISFLTSVARSSGYTLAADDIKITCHWKRWFWSHRYDNDYIWAVESFEIFTAISIWLWNWCGRRIHIAEDCNDKKFVAKIRTYVANFCQQHRFIRFRITDMIHQKFHNSIFPRHWNVNRISLL